MKLNLGCGHNHVAGFVNVDASPACGPDMAWDLEATPWPWPDDSVTEARFIHSLEHMGGDPQVFLAIMKELYRIMAPGGVVIIYVPHPRHDNFINDPTHVRAITPAMLRLFDRDLNDQWQRAGLSNTPLAHYTGVNFRIDGTTTVLAEPYATQLRDGVLSQEQASLLLRERNNVAEEYRIKLFAIKATAPEHHAGLAGAATGA